MFKITDVNIATDQGPRDYQQDRAAHITHSNRQLLVIADGMGGHPNGDLAAQTVIDNLAAANEKTVKSAIEKADKDCDNSNDGRGSTVVVAEFANDELYIYHAGDSRAYLLRADKLVQLTDDHSYGHYLANGVGFLNEVASKKILIEDQDTIILTTDGVHDYLEHSDMTCAITLARNSDKNLSEILVERALNGTHDNCTVLSFKIKEQ